MNLIIYFLLISGISFIADGTNPVPLTAKDIKRIIEENKSITDSEDHNLKLLKNGKLGQTSHSLVWKCVYNNQTVAVKIVWDREAFNHEIDVLKALNAIENPQIEDHGIPKIYYHGQILEVYSAIAMTLFDGSLESRFNQEKKHFTDLTILTIFKQAVKILEYLHEREVLHNDIKPDNMFLLGSKVFIGDFDLGKLKGGSDSRRGYTRKFASSNYFACQERRPIDDFESLVFSIWYVACVPRDRIVFVGFGEEEPEGYVLYKSYKSKKAKEKVLQKCSHFKNPIVQVAFKQICAVEMISGKSIPNYNGIINILAGTIDKLNGNSKPHQFEWLKKRANILHRR